jgi:hypothetical protein
MRTNTPQLTGAERATVWLGTAVWIGGIAASLVLTLATDQPTEWLIGFIAAVSVGGLMAVAVVIGRSALRRQGVERTVNIQASALAFWITMGALLTYSMIDAFADVPAVRAQWVLFAGLVSWAVAQAARLERYR